MQPVQIVEAPRLNMEAPGHGGFETKCGGSRVWKNNGTKKIKAQPQPRQKAPKTSNTHLQVKENSIMPKRNKYAHKPKTHASQKSIFSSYVLRRNNLGKVVVGMSLTYM